MIRLVIVCPSADADKFRETVSKFASYDWEQRGQIRLWEIRTDDSPQLLILIFDSARSQAVDCVMVSLSKES